MNILLTFKSCSHSYVNICVVCVCAIVTNPFKREVNLKKACRHIAMGLSILRRGILHKMTYRIEFSYIQSIDCVSVGHNVDMAVCLLRALSYLRPSVSPSASTLAPNSKSKTRNYVVLVCIGLKKETKRKTAKKTRMAANRRK